MHGAVVWSRDVVSVVSSLKPARPNAVIAMLSTGLTTMLVATNGLAQVHIPQGVTGRKQLAATGGGNWLTEKLLGMPRSQIEFSGLNLLLFNGCGSISILNKCVTGLQRLRFPPIEVPNYRFYLAFRDAKTGALIQDIRPEIYNHRAPGYYKAVNFTPGLPFVLLLQRSYWEPNAFYRTGTFDKKIAGRWISFRIKTKASVSAVADEVFLRVEIQNRKSAPLILTTIPDQLMSPSAVVANTNTLARSFSQGSWKNIGFNTVESKLASISVVSSLPEQKNKAGWDWVIAGRSKSTATFAIILHQLPAAPPAASETGIPRLEKAASQAQQDQLRWAASRLPDVSTGDPAFDDLYRRCILSVLMCRWNRKNFVTHPFYAVGIWRFMVAWDTSFASKMLSVLDPTGLRKSFLTELRTGVLDHSYVPWSRKASPHGSYVQGPFAAMRILQDYLRQTGDTGILNKRVGKMTVFEKMKQMGLQMEKRYALPDGLLDFGTGSVRFLEISTDGYQHVVATDNGLAFAYFRQLVAWCKARKDPAAAKFEQWTNKLDHSMNQKLWEPKVGWFVNLYPDGTRHLVWSYHLFDLLDSGILSAEQQHLMIGHLREGEFLGPYGMYSMSKADLIHWDREDADWGGGGQYVGMPLRVVESLYQLGYSEIAWDILARCTRWPDHFPYIPQEIFTNYPGSPAEEMPLSLSAGGGVQAVLFGVFGLRPHVNGSLDISPAYHHELGVARMTGYRFRGHTYDVVMGPWRYKVYQDGRLAARNVYGTTTVFPAH